MALWYNCGRGFVKASFAKADLGADAYLCCPGPSLADVDDSKIHVPGAMIFGLNTSYPKIRPDVWIGMDRPECYDRSLWWQPFIKICRGSFGGIDCEGIPIKTCNNVYFADVETPKDYQSTFSNRAHDIKFAWYNHTLGVALHILVWMGARTIYLVGCDFGGNKDYYDNRVLSDVSKKRNKLLYDKQIHFVEVFNSYAQRWGIQVNSCSPVSPINKFLNFVSLEKALERSKKRVPKVNNILYSADVEKCQWKNSIEADKGVMVGCSKVHEDLLPWWIDNYKKFNKFPVVFADFGISDSMKKYCEQYGKVINMVDVDLEGWFRKPFAILRAPFKKIIWFDVDVEIKNSIDFLFDYAENGKPAMGQDTYDPVQFRVHMKDSWVLFDTGVIVVEHGARCIKNWCMETLSVPRGFYLGDHQIFSIVLHRDSFSYNMIPKSIHRMRMEKGDQKDVVVMHWTGMTGKEHIRSIMQNSKISLVVSTLYPGSEILGQHRELENTIDFLNEFIDKKWFEKYTLKLVVVAPKSSIVEIRNELARFKNVVDLQINEMLFEYDENIHDYRRPHEIDSSKKQLFEVYKLLQFDYLFFCDSDMKISFDDVDRCVGDLKKDGLYCFMAIPYCLRDQLKQADHSFGCFLCSKKLLVDFDPVNVAYKIKQQKDGKYTIMGAGDCNVYFYLVNQPNLRKIKPMFTTVKHYVSRNVCNIYSKGVIKQEEE
jgi:hypothetical protein